MPPPLLTSPLSPGRPGKKPRSPWLAWYAFTARRSTARTAALAGWCAAAEALGAGLRAAPRLPPLHPPSTTIKASAASSLRLPFMSAPQGQFNRPGVQLGPGVFEGAAAGHRDPVQPQPGADVGHHERELAL